MNQRTYNIISLISIIIIAIIIILYLYKQYTKAKSNKVMNNIYSFYKSKVKNVSLLPYFHNYLLQNTKLHQLSFLKDYQCVEMYLQSIGCVDHDYDVSFMISNPWLSFHDALLFSVQERSQQPTDRQEQKSQVVVDDYTEYQNLGQALDIPGLEGHINNASSSEPKKQKKQKIKASKDENDASLLQESAQNMSEDLMKQLKEGNI